MKIVRHKDRSEETLDGKLYCNTIRNLREQFDEYEGTTPLKGEFRVVGPSGVEHMIAEKDLLEPPTMSLNLILNLNVYCMFAWVMPKDGDNIVFDPKVQLGGMEKLIETFGEYAVVIMNTTEFIQRVEAAAKAPDRIFGRAIVEYVDDPRFGDDLQMPKTGREWVKKAFQKRRRYANEREYRFAFQSGRSRIEPFTLDIGSIRDIAQLVNVRDIYDQLKVNGRSINDHLSQ